MTDDTYTKENMIIMEAEIANVLKFNFTSPSALHFLYEYIKDTQFSEDLYNICNYLIDLSLLDLEMAHFLPSEIAAASLLIMSHFYGLAHYWVNYHEYANRHVDKKLT